MSYQRNYVISVFTFLTLQGCNTLEVNLAESLSPEIDKESFINRQTIEKDLAKLKQINANIAAIEVLDDDLEFPRNVVTHKDEIWLVDKGSSLLEYGQKRGAIYRYHIDEHGLEKTAVLTNLEDPNDIALRQHNDGSLWAYFTTRDQVQRFNTAQIRVKDNAIQTEVVLDNLPTLGWHKLLAFELTLESLYLTVPSYSDHCEIDQLRGLVATPCYEEGTTAEIREYRFHQDQLSNSYRVVAQGLRAALATAKTSRNSLLAADNGWDHIDLKQFKLDYQNTPKDELNVIDLKRESPTHYGWPYCFDTESVTPVYQRFNPNCANFQAPSILLPPHSAPLSMIYDPDDQRALINLHGNNSNGAKTVEIKLDEHGRPTGLSTVLIDWFIESDRLPRPMGITVAANVSNNIYSNSTLSLLVSDDWAGRLYLITIDDSQIRSDRDKRSD